MAGGILGLTLPVEKRTIDIVNSSNGTKPGEMVSQYKNATEDGSGGETTVVVENKTVKVDVVPFIVGGGAAYGAYHLAVAKGKKKYAWAWALGAGVAGIIVGGLGSKQLYKLTK